MAVQLKDGKGRGYLGEIDSKQRVRCYSVIEDAMTYINRTEGEMYSGTWGSSGLIADVAGDFIIYLKNTSNKDMVISEVQHRCTGAVGTVSLWLGVTGTPGGTLTTLTPANRNAGSNNTADCIYYSSGEITGLSGGSQVGWIYGKDGEEYANFVPPGGYILPPNGALAIKADNTIATHFGGLGFYFKEQETV